MNRRSFLQKSSATLCAAAAGTSRMLRANPDRPNVLVFVADDVGWRDFGCYGNRAVRTPRIDQLAEEGLRFENAFLTTPQCSPSRISVLTGKYAHATGAEDLHMPLPVGEKILPHYLAGRGYFSGHMRKTHYGEEGDRQFDWYAEDPEEFPSFLDAAGERPFFLWVGFRDAHRPYSEGALSPPHDPAAVEVPPYLRDEENTRRDLALYYDEVGRMDRRIGAMIDELEHRGLSEQTMVIFFSDNGMPFPRAKGTLYDSGIGTPLVVRWPHRIQAGRVYDGLASVIDLAPTLLEAAGREIPSEMQGRSILPVLEGRSQSGREAVFAERNWHNCDEHMRSLRTRRFKVIRNSYTELPFGNPADVSRSPSWYALKRAEGEGDLSPAQKAIFQVPRPAIELYDLEQDPWETVNLAGREEQRERVAELTRRLDDWSRETNDFPPTRRRRGDNTDRITGVKFTQEIPALQE